MTTKDYNYCSNCKNFRQHYVNIENVGIRKAACGHCISHKIKYGCEYFEKANKQQNCDKLEIINFLISTKNHLQHFMRNLEQLKTQLKKQTKTK